MKKSNKSLLLILSTLSLISLARLFDNTDSRVIDILSHFPFQYAVLSFLVLGYCLWKRMTYLAIISSILFLVNINPAIHITKLTHATEHKEDSFKLYSANIHKYNSDLSELQTKIMEANPDILLLLEVTTEHSIQLQSIVKKYPYIVKRSSLGQEGMGFILLSNYPVLEHEVTVLSEICNFIAKVKIEINQKPVLFYGFHARRPDIDNFNERKDQFLRLADDIKEQSLPVIIAGDFNTTPYSPIFKKFINITGLKDSREGFGWQPSWPTFFPPLWIPIDHVLVSPDIKVHKRKTGSYIGSDHYPVIAELSVGN